jgi:serine/threonine protein kinase
MIELCGMGIIHRDLKASNIFVTPAKSQKDGSFLLHYSGKVELKEDLAYD